MINRHFFWLWDGGWDEGGRMAKVREHTHNEIDDTNSSLIVDMK